MKKSIIKISIVFAFIFLFSQVTFGQKPKYIFVFIGDGMGLAQVHSTNTFLHATHQDSLLFTQFAVQGITSTRCVGSYITDSGASGTAIACGEKTETAVIGMDSTKTKKLTSIAEIAKKNGYKVGIVTTVSIDHATPSAFYAHQTGRSSFYEISLDLANSNFDYFGGGSFEEPKGKNKNQRDIYEILKEKNYQVVSNYKDFVSLKPSNQKVLISSSQLDNEQSLPFTIDEPNSEFTLAGFTKKGIELLDNPKGFFMMVEGGKIDWACHSNDGFTAMNEVISFNKSIAEAMDFYKKHPKETLIIVTADHETGGMSMGYTETGYKLYYDLLVNQKVSIGKFTDQISSFLKSKENNVELEDMMPLVQKNFGLKMLAFEDFKKLKEDAKSNKSLQNSFRLALTKFEIEMLRDALEKTINPANKKDQEHKILYGSDNPFARTVVKIFNNKAGLAWTTTSHTGIPIGTFAIGAGSQLFYGFYENSDIPSKIKKASGLK